MSSRSNNDNNVKKISAKLQQGWKLLGQTCPNDSCITPLLRNLDDKMWCVNCEMWILLPAQATSSKSIPSEPSSTSTSTSSSSKASPSSSPSNGTNAALNDDDDEEEPNPHSRRVRPNRVSASTSGLVSLSSNPNFADLQKQLASTQDDKRDKNKQEETARLNRESENRMKKLNDISQKLGEKMISGWTLLADHCPTPSCGCPLVRNKHGTTLCVSCGSVYDSELNPSADMASNATSANDSANVSAVNTPTPQSPTFTSKPSQSKDMKMSQSDAPDGSSSEEDNEAHNGHGRYEDEYRDSITTPPAIKAHLNRVNSVSQLLGERMLAGWTLLGVNCPNEECNAPLVKKNGTMFCVSCQANVVTDSEYDPNIHGPALNANTDAQPTTITSLTRASSSPLKFSSTPASTPSSSSSSSSASSASPSQRGSVNSKRESTSDPAIGTGTVSMIGFQSSLSPPSSQRSRSSSSVSDSTFFETGSLRARHNYHRPPPLPHMRRYPSDASSSMTTPPSTPLPNNLTPNTINTALQTYPLSRSSSIDSTFANNFPTLFSPTLSPTPKTGYVAPPNTPHPMSLAQSSNHPPPHNLNGVASASASASGSTTPPTMPGAPFDPVNGTGTPSMSRTNSLCSSPVAAHINRAYNASSANNSAVTSPTIHPYAPHLTTNVDNTPTITVNPVSGVSSPVSLSHANIEMCRSALLGKMGWCAELLTNTNSLEQTRDVATVIQSLAGALASLQNISYSL